MERCRPHQPNSHEEHTVGGQHQHHLLKDNDFGLISLLRPWHFGSKQSFHGDGFQKMKWLNIFPSPSVPCSPKSIPAAPGLGAVFLPLPPERQ